MAPGWVHTRVLFVIDTPILMTLQTLLFSPLLVSFIVLARKLLELVTQTTPSRLPSFSWLKDIKRLIWFDIVSSSKLLMGDSCSNAELY